MEKNTLYQSGFLLNRKWFEIGSDGLSVRYKSLLGNGEYYVKFEQLGVKTIKSKSGNMAWLIIAFFAVGVAILLFVDELGKVKPEYSNPLFYLVAGLLCLLTYLFTYKRVFHLTRADNTNAITFLIDKPSKVVLQNFIQQIKDKRKDYLVGKYGLLTSMLPYEQQHQNLLWLNNIDALTHEGYSEKIAELNRLFQSTPGVSQAHLN